jgi:hypothetical protein
LKIGRQKQKIRSLASAVGSGSALAKVMFWNDSLPPHSTSSTGAY